MDKPVFRMSESGKCQRALSAKLLGYEPTPAPEWLERSAEEGNWHEARIIDQLRKQDNVYNQQLEIIFNYPTFALVGHIDGVIEDYDHQREAKLLEIKSMSQFEFDRWMRGNFKEFPNYASQITCYMEATGLKKCLYIVKNRNNGYEDRRTLTEKPASINDIIIKLQEIIWATQQSKLCDADFDPQSLECRRCEYRHLCVPEPKELTPIEQASLSAAAENWRRGKQLMSQGEELVNKAREVFETHTRATNINKWWHSGLAIQLVHYGEQKTYPKANLLKIFTEEQLKPCEQTKEAYDQLRISDLKADNG